MALTLRPYQNAMLDTFLREARRGIRNVVGCIPTGGGKSPVINEMCRMAKKALVIVPGRVLLNQMHYGLEQSLGKRVEIEQGERRASRTPYLQTQTTLAMRHSLISNDRYLSPAFHDVSCVIVDECHWGITERFSRVLRHFHDRGAFVFGVSATPYKGKGKALAFWNRPSFVYPLTTAVEEGYLARPMATMHEMKSLDYQFVDAFRDEWTDQRLLDAVLQAEQFSQEVAQMIVQTYAGEQSVVYAANKNQAMQIVDVLERYGCRVAYVYSGQTSEARDAHIKAFRTGEAKLIVNCDVLTFGWDVPELRNVYMAAPTRSLTRYLQRLGRVLRLLPGTIEEGMTHAERIAAIAASDKPYGHVHDITNSSRDIELLTAYEVLDAQARKNAKRRGRMRQKPSQGEQVDVLNAVEAQNLEEEIARLERQEEIRERRRKVLVGVTFESTDRDLTQDPDSAKKSKKGWRMFWGPYRGELIRDLPTDYLSSVVTRARKQTPLISAIQREIDWRSKAK